MLAASCLLLAALIYYLALCAFQPFARCRKCAGLGRLKRGRKVKTCRRCRGKGARLRRGRRMFNRWLRTREAGTR